MTNYTSNNNCGCGEPVCTTCGRPQLICKGSCGCNCCNNKVNFCEYGRQAKGCIREVEPGCPMQAVIPSVVVDDVSGLKNLADCFVHVTSINTTFYIDDKHRAMITWAGHVNVDDYDYEANPLNLRNQTVYDFRNEKAYIYDAQGNYVVDNFNGGGSGGTSDYEDLENQPQINNVTLSGDQSSDDLGLQDKLVSGTNIKTINNLSLLGSGNISISGGGGGGVSIQSIGRALLLDENGELSVGFPSAEANTLFDYGDLIPYYVNADGSITASDTALCSELVSLEAGKSYTLENDLSSTVTNEGLRVRVYDTNGNFVLAPTQTQYDNTYMTITPSNQSYPYNSTEYTFYAKSDIKIRVMFMDKTKITEATLTEATGATANPGKIFTINSQSLTDLADFSVLTANTFKGKALGAIGDSITIGQYATKAYPNIVAERLGMSVTNAAVGGNTLSQIYNQIANLPASLDVVLFMGGTNNYKQTGVEGTLGTLYDSSTKTLNTDNTVCGWYNKILTALRNKYPEALICILTPPKSTNNVSVSSTPYDFLQLNEAIKHIAELHSVPCFDVCSEVPINSWNEESAKIYYTHIWTSGEYSGQRDITHPTDKGQQAIAEYVIGKLFTYSGYYKGTTEGA